VTGNIAAAICRSALTAADVLLRSVPASYTHTLPPDAATPAPSAQEEDLLSLSQCVRTPDCAKLCSRCDDPIYPARPTLPSPVSPTGRSRRASSHEKRDKASSAVEPVLRRALLFTALVFAWHHAYITASIILATAHRVSSACEQPRKEGHPVRPNHRYTGT